VFAVKRVADSFCILVFVWSILSMICLATVDNAFGTRRALYNCINHWFGFIWNIVCRHRGTIFGVTLTYWKVSSRGCAECGSGIRFRWLIYYPATSGSGGFFNIRIHRNHRILGISRSQGAPGPNIRVNY